MLINNKIRFIDSDYNELFVVENGETVKIHHPSKRIYYPWEGNTYYLRVFFIDNYHLKIRGKVYHIRQLAEEFEKLGITVCQETKEHNDAVYYFGHNTKTFLHIWRKHQIEDYYAFSLIYMENEYSFIEVEKGEYFFPEGTTSYTAREHILQEVKGYSQVAIDFFEEYQIDLDDKPRYLVDSDIFWEKFYECPSNKNI